MANDYNKTLNLPKTEFPMRANLPKREPEMLKRWYDMDLYGEMLKKNEGHPLFSLHDGPPFSNGGLHIGHALNKSLKDFITRYYAMQGYYAPYIPGWEVGALAVRAETSGSACCGIRLSSAVDSGTAVCSFTAAGSSTGSVSSNSESWLS